MLRISSKACRAAGDLRCIGAVRDLAGKLCAGAAPDHRLSLRLCRAEDVVRVDRERRTPEYVDGEIIVKLRPSCDWRRHEAAREEFTSAWSSGLR